MASQTFTITEASGLHARPTTLLVNAAAKFQSKITITYNDRTVDLKSILGVMSLAVAENGVITITTEGADEDAALAGIAETITSQNLGK